MNKLGEEANINMHAHPKFSPERTLYLLITLSFIITALSAFLTNFWSLELFSHFRIQYVLIGSILIPILAWRRAFWYAAVILIITAIHSLQIWPYLHATSVQATNPEAHTRIMFANVHYLMEDFTKVYEVLDAYDPDIVVFAEIQEEPFQAIASTVTHRYPFSVHAEGVGAYDLSVIAKNPPLTHTTSYYVPNNPSIYLEFDIDGKTFGLLGIHAFSPMNSEYSQMRNEKLERSAEYLESIELPVMLIGDFNITQFSPIYRSIFSNSRLKDTQREFGIQPSWPAQMAPLTRIPIDHVLVSDEITVHQRFLGLPTGSDHLPVLVDISL